MENRTVSIVLIVIVVVLVLACLCVVGLILAGGGFVWRTANQPYDVIVSVSAPIQATQGDEVVIEVLIENPTTESQELDSIDIDLTYLDGLHIQRTDPPYQDTLSLSPIFEQQSYLFYQTIPAESELTVSFHCAAVKSGDFYGQIDVCINSGGNCQGHQVRTVVEE